MKFRFKADGFVYAEDIDDALRVLSEHFADPMNDDTNNVQANITLKPNEGPHSRACGIRIHKHGTECHSNCPTCGGRDD